MVVRAWDLAVATMRTGEKSRFYCKDAYVYADETAPSADSSQQYNILYDIELLHWQGLVHLCAWLSHCYTYNDPEVCSFSILITKFSGSVTRHYFCHAVSHTIYVLSFLCGRFSVCNIFENEIYT